MRNDENTEEIAVQASEEKDGEKQTLEEVTVQKNDAVTTSVGNISATTSTTISKDSKLPTQIYSVQYNKTLKGVQFDANLAQNGGEISHSEQISYSKDFRGLNFGTSLGEDNGTITHGAQLGYNGTFDSGVSVNATIGQENGEFTYNGDVGYSHEFKGKTTLDANLTTNKDDTSIRLGVKKPLLNPDNPMGVENQDKERKEELVETGERFNLQSKIGYSDEQGGIYTENSLMYRVDDNNFLNTSYSQNDNTRIITTSADLKHVNLSYSNTKGKEEITTTTTNSLNSTLKGGKNQYNLGLNAVKTKIGESEENPTTTVSKNLTITTGATFNRTEYGEFQDGLNGAISTDVSFENGSFSGYNVTFDGAYNKYGTDKSGKDFLLQSKVDFGKDDSTKRFATTLLSAYRINNCNTIFESGTGYSTNYSSDARTKQFSFNGGVYQQVGKNFGDATVFAKGKVGKVWTKTTDGTKSHPFGELQVGTRVKATPKLALDTSVTYGSGGKIGGEIGARYTF